MYLNNRNTVLKNVVYIIFYKQCKNKKDIVCITASIFIIICTSETKTAIVHRIKISS